MWNTLNFMVDCYTDTMATQHARQSPGTYAPSLSRKTSFREGVQ
jgi:hypothetical protein